MKQDVLETAWALGVWGSSESVLERFSNLLIVDPRLLTVPKISPPRHLQSENSNISFSELL